MSVSQFDSQHGKRSITNYPQSRQSMPAQVALPSYWEMVYKMFKQLCARIFA